MKNRNLLVTLAFAGTTLFPSMFNLTANAQQPPPASSAPAPEHNWTTEQAVTSSVREAWALGGKTPEGFFEIVRTLAEISAQKRGVAVPENEQAGAKAGEWIKKQAKKDPDQLLYVIVDRAVQFSATRTASK